jgi:hypothetical protein
VVAQADPSPGDQAPNGVLVCVEHRCDLVIGMAGQLAHQQRRPLTLRQLTHARQYRVQLGADPIAGRLRDGLDIRRALMHPLPPAGRVDRRVATHPDQPRPQVARRVGAQRHHQSGERLLRRILGVMPRAEDDDADREHAAPVAVIEHRERRLVAGGEPLAERRVGP